MKVNWGKTSIKAIKLRYLSITRNMAKRRKAVCRIQRIQNKRNGGFSVRIMKTNDIFLLSFAIRVK